MNQSVCNIPAGAPVLVTGATGFTGLVLTRKLVEAGAKVSAVARSSSNLAPLKDLDIKWFTGDVHDDDLIARAVSGQEYIFHVAAAFRQARSSERDYWNVHVKSTQLLATEALKNPRFKRLVHFSTIGVHGHIASPPATEDSAFDPDDEYQKTKLDAELWLKDFSGKHGLPYTVIRPAAIYGPGDKRLLKLFRMALKPVFILLGKGKCMYHLVHVDDLTNAALVASTHPDASGEAFIVAADEPFAIVDIAQIVAEHFGKTFRVLRLPIGPFFLAADLCERICRPLGIEPPIYRRRVAFYSKDRHFDVAKMKNVLGYHPRHTNRNGIVETADWYAGQGWLTP
ncbi:NAD-dependent epimerase/dehydratase family protein [Desulfonatronum parangueonense]